MKPALTAEEWEFGPRLDEPVTEHKQAALALYGQPFGFTREDVKRLREWTHFEARSEDGLVLEVFQMTKEWFNSLADRIEALLPPES